MTISFDELFAYRIQLLDYTTDEYTIIKHLKNKLYNNELNNDEINKHLLEFYNSFGIAITNDTLESINPVNPVNPIVEIFQNSIFSPNALISLIKTLKDSGTPDSKLLFPLTIVS